MAATFQATLDVKKRPDGDPVYYKQDGQRFPHSITVKMNVAQAYMFTLTFRPSMILERWLIRGEKYDFSRVKPKNEEEEISIYETEWSSVGIEVTKRNSRKDIPIVLEFQHGVTLNTKLQVKFYPSHETEHTRWGLVLHAVEMQCHVPDGQFIVDIQKEKVF